MDAPATLPPTLADAAPPAARAPSSRDRRDGARAAGNGDAPGFPQVLAEQRRAGAPAAGNTAAPARDPRRGPRRADDCAPAEAADAAQGLARQALEIALGVAAQQGGGNAGAAAAKGPDPGAQAVSTREAAPHPAAGRQARTLAAEQPARDAAGRDDTAAVPQAADKTVRLAEADAPDALASAFGHAAAPRESGPPMARGALAGDTGPVSRTANGTRPGAPVIDRAGHAASSARDAPDTDDGPAQPPAAQAAAPAPHATGAIAAAQPVATASALPAAADPPPTAAGIATPLREPGWDADLGRQLVWLSRSADGGRHTAELRLDPPDLGPLRVTLQISDGIAQAAFVSPHAAVRQAVESAMPQLQQALSQAGISLGQASVSDQGARQDPGRPQGGGQRRPGPVAGGPEAAGDAAPAAAPARADALVDTFA